MEIRNVTEFRNFVVNNKLSVLSQEIHAVVVCVADYERGRSCWKASDRDRIYANCKALYVKAVGLVARQFASNFSAYSLDRINFSLDGVPLVSVGR